MHDAKLTSHSSTVPTAAKTIRLYGVSLHKVAASVGSAVASDRVEPETLSIVYCGFKAGSNEVRVPTGRVFSLPKDQVGESGEVSDFVVAGEPVRYYDVSFAADLRENVSRRISLANELIGTTGGTFAGLVATPPTRPAVDLSVLESLSRDELLARVRASANPGLANDEMLPGGCEGYCQTYKRTDYGVGHREDEWGGDCD